MTKRLSLFFSTFILLAVLHTIAIEAYLYWMIWWFDMPMHFLGGFVVALGISILPFIGITIYEKHPSILLVLASVFAVALLWEVFEFVMGIAVTFEDYIIDTMIDMILGMAGGYVGYCLTLKRNKRT